MHLPSIFRYRDNEGGMVLVTSLLLLSVLMAIGTTAIKQTSTDIKISGNYKTSQQSLYDADAGVQYMLSRIRNDSSLDLTANPVTVTYSTPAGFSFTLPSSVTNLGSDKYRFQVTGNAGTSAKKTIEATFRLTATIPGNPDGALGMYGDDSTVTLTGGGSPHGPRTIDGKDYNVPTSFNCSGAGCQGTDSGNAPVPGLYTEDLTPTVNDSLPHSQIDGDPDVTSGGGGNSEQDWIDFANYCIPRADNTNPATTGSGALGTRTAPEITVVDEYKTYAGTVDGAGILIVNDPGSAHFSGTFHWEGLIILLGGATVSFTGNAYLYGAVVMADYTSKSITLTGASNIMYSSDAIDNLKNISKLRRVEVTAWKDENL